VKILLVIPSREITPGTGYTKFPDELLPIAAVLEKHGHEVKIHDSNMDDCQPKAFMPFNPDIVGFSVATGPNIADSINKSIEFKKILPNVKIVWGYRHPSSLPEQTLIEPYIDYVIIGAGEYTTLELTRCLETGDVKLSEIKGLAYKENGKVVINEPRHPVDDLNELPDPAWHLIDIKKYWDVTLNVSRGCPIDCTFCTDRTFYKGYISDLAPERIISQTEHLNKQYGVDYILFSGEHFAVNHKNLQQFCHLATQKKLKVKWSCPVSIPLNEEDIALMAKAGCSAVLFEIESGSQKILDLLNKGNVGEMERTFWLLVKYGIIPNVCLMYGFPTETSDDFKMSLELIQRLDNPPYLLMKYVPYPDTLLFDYCIKKGLITAPKKLSEWTDFYLRYANEINLSEIPDSMIAEAVAKHRKTYSIQRLSFTMKHKKASYLEIIRNPIKFLRSLSKLIKYHLSQKSPAP